MKMATIRARPARGGGVEFALALPVLVTLIYGIFQVGLLYEANAGMQHALGEGARFGHAVRASRERMHRRRPMPTIQARMTSKLFGKGDGTFTVDDPGPPGRFRDLAVTYTKTMNFLFFPGRRSR